MNARRQDDPPESPMTHRTFPVIEGDPRPGLLDEVTRAIEAEWRRARRRTRIRIEAVDRVDAPDPALFRLRFATDAKKRRPTEWMGGTVSQALDDTLPGDFPMSADVLDIDRAGEVAIVRPWEPDRPPVVGEAWIGPFDFLKAAHGVLTSPAFEGLRPALHRLLAAAEDTARGVAVPPPRGIDDLPEAFLGSFGRVWGPPGTGKTYTLGRSVAQLLADPTERILVVSTSHRAADEAALQVGEHTRDLGREVAVATRVKRVVALQPFEEAELTALLPGDLEAMRRLDRLHAERARASTALERIRIDRAIAALRGRFPTLEQIAGDPEVRVAVTTVHAAIALLANSPHASSREAPFTTVVLDEAGLVSLAVAGMVALLAGRRFVSVGDPMQLPPIEQAGRTAPPEVARWLQRSPLDVLRRAAAPHATRLQVQRRMHPDIRKAVSRLAYDNHLTDDPKTAAARRDHRLPGAAGCLTEGPRAVWWALDRDPSLRSGRGPVHAGAKRDGGRSWCRPDTEHALARLAELAPELKAVNGLFVTPFRAQVEHAARWLEGLGWDGWTASSVHRQQGAQADVVIFDTVDASKGWQPVDWQRLANVGLSRARHLVIVLSTTAEWRQVWLRPLKDLLPPRQLVAGARGPRFEAVTEAQSLFAPPPSPSAPTPTAPAPTAPTPASSTSRGAQLDQQRQRRAVLTRRQEELLHLDLGRGGPRLVRGVAGSGKTLILAHWVAKVLSQAGPTERVAVVFGNEALRPWLARHIHDAWDALATGRRLPLDRLDLHHALRLTEDLASQAHVDLSTVGDRWDVNAKADRVLGHAAPSPRYRWVFLEESQDFGPRGIELFAQLAEPQQGRRNVVILYDDAQNLYRRPRPTWRELGLDLRGRSHVLRTSFRSTRAIMSFALSVLEGLADRRLFESLRKHPSFRELVSADDPTAITPAPGGGWNAGFCVEDGEPVTVAVDHPDDDAEHAWVAEQVRRLVIDEGVRPSHIRLLGLGKDDRFPALHSALGRALPEHVPIRRAVGRELDPDHDGLLITTPHSFKGMDAEVVFVVGAGSFYSSTRGRFLPHPLYVALTRARSLLFVSGSRRQTGSAVLDVLREVAERQC